MLEYESIIFFLGSINPIVMGLNRAYNGIYNPWVIRSFVIYSDKDNIGNMTRGFVLECIN